MPTGSNALADEPFDEHGGDLAGVQVAYPRAPQPWLDLSTGINPWPYPVGRITPAQWERLPGRREERQLQSAAAAHFGCSAGDVVVAPGSQAIIQWLPQLRRPSRVTIIAPTYSEHARSWTRAGHAVRFVGRDHAPDDATDVLVVGRPNNPDGRRAPAAWLDLWARHLAKRGGWLVIDEAFGDCISLGDDVHGHNVIALRSFGKFFGLAGVRLGFAICTPTVALPLRDALGPWCTPGPALAIATRAYGDKAWIQRTVRRLQVAAHRLDKIGAAGGLQEVGGTLLFRLFEAADAPRRIVTLARAGIHVRRFAAAPTWLRIGHPSSPAGRERLAAALGRR